MRHPSEGVLRRLVDEPAGVSDTDREHVAGCPRCLDGLTAVRSDAEAVGAALATRGSSDETAAWQRLTAAAASKQPAAPQRPRARRALLLRRPVVAGLAVAVVLGGGSAAAANDWMQIFRTEQVAPVTFTTAELNALPDLGAYGRVDLANPADVHQVPDAATAARETGLDVPRLADLPRGVTGEPEYQVGSEASATFTFDAALARKAAEAAGTTLPPVPEGLDGSRVRLDAGPGVAAVWSQGNGIPSLVVARGVAPKAFSDGVPFETMRDYILALPGLPDDVANQLRAFNADGSTLPLPVPADRVTTRSAQVQGAPATVLATRDRALAAAVWVQDGIVTVVAGAMDGDEVLDVAAGVR